MSVYAFRQTKGPLAMNFAVVLPVFLLWTALSSCATTSVSSDYDHSANFDHLKTYAWMTADEEPKRTRVKNSLIMTRIQDAVDRQLDAKGYRKAPESPDFFVVYHVSVDEKTQIHSIPYYGGGVGVHGFSALYADVYQNRHEEGTLILDIFNSETKNLLWRGIAKGFIDTRDDPKTNSKRINDAVGKILEQFPPKEKLERRNG